MKRILVIATLALSSVALAEDAAATTTHEAHSKTKKSVKKADKAAPAATDSAASTETKTETKTESTKKAE